MVRVILEVLINSNDTPGTNLDVIKLLQEYTCESIEPTDAIVDIGLIPVLLRCAECADGSTSLAAVEALHELSYGSDYTVSAIMDADGLTTLVTIMENMSYDSLRVTLELLLEIILQIPDESGPALTQAGAPPRIVSALQSVDTRVQEIAAKVLAECLGTS